MLSISESSSACFFRLADGDSLSSGALRFKARGLTFGGAMVVCKSSRLVLNSARECS